MSRVRDALLAACICSAFVGCEDPFPPAAPEASDAREPESAAPPVTTASPSSEDPPQPAGGDSVATPDDSTNSTGKPNALAGIDPENYPNPFGAPNAPPQQPPSYPAQVGAGGSSTSAVSNEVRLRTGVALAQTLPSGTGMAFSVSYDFIGGAPDPACQYIWVIETAKGQGINQPANLSNSGTLQAIVPGLRPENGPFSCHLVEVGAAGRRPLCRPYALR